MTMFVLLTAIVFVLVGQGALAQDAITMSRHAVTGVTITHPAKWEATQTAAYLGVSAPSDSANDAFRENVNVMLQPVTEGTSLRAAVRAEGLMTAPGVSDVTIVDTTWNGKAAMVIRYRHSGSALASRIPLRVEMWARMEFPDVLLLASFTADEASYGRSYALARTMLASIVFMDRKP